MLLFSPELNNKNSMCDGRMGSTCRFKSGTIQDVVNRAEFVACTFYFTVTLRQLSFQILWSWTPKCGKLISY